MLRKVLSIKNVGRFEDCRWRGGSQFESMALIFAENARGKSTNGKAEGSHLNT